MIYLLLAFLVGLAVKLSMPGIAPRLKKLVNLYVVYIGFPLFLFVMLLSARGMDQGRIMMFSLVSSIFYMLLFYWVIRNTPYDRKLKASLFVTTTFGNVGFIGIPVVLAFFGPVAAGLSSIYIIFLNLVYFSLAVFLSNTYMKHGMSALLDFVKFPGLWGSIIAYTLSLLDFTVPHQVVAISHGTIYLGTFIIGLAFDYSKIRELHSRSALVMGSILKFIVLPLLLITPAILLSMEKEFTLAMLILSTVPPAVASTSLAVEYGFDDAFTATFSSFSTMLYLLIVTAIQMAL